MKDKNKKMLAIILPVVAIFSVFYSFTSLQGGDQESDPAWESEAERSQQQTDQNEFMGCRLKEPAGVVDAGDVPASTEAGRNGAYDDKGLAEKINLVLGRLGKNRKEIEAVEQEAPAPPLVASAPSGLSPANENPRASSGSQITQPHRLEIRGILMNGQNSCALIGGYIRREGEFLPGGYQVVKIKRKSVHIRKPGESKEEILFLEPHNGVRSGCAPRSGGGGSSKE